jgi:hypothetical protein
MNMTLTEIRAELEKRLEFTKNVHLSNAKKFKMDTKFVVKEIDFLSSLIEIVKKAENKIKET